MILDKKTLISVLILLIMGLMAYATSIFLNIFVSNYITPELYGDFTLTIRSLNLISAFLLLGSGFVSIKYLSKYISNKENDYVICFISWNLKLILKTSILCIILCAILFAVIYILHILNVKDLSSYHHVAYTLWLAPFAAFASLLCCYLLSIKKRKLFFVMEQIAQQLFLLLIFCIAIFFFDIKLEFSSIILIVFFVLLIIITIESVSLSNLFKNYIKERKNVILQTQPGWMQDSLKFIFSNMIYAIMCAIDLYIIEIFHKNEAGVGHYSAILAIGSILVLTIPKATSTILKPKIFTMICNNKHQELKKLTHSIIFINIISLTPVLLVIIIFPKSILGFFGAEYSSAYLPLIIVSISYFFAGVIQPSAILLFYINATKGVKIDALQLLLTVCLGIPFTCMWGLLGISISVAIALTLSVLYKYVSAIKEMEKLQRRSTITDVFLETNEQ